MLAKGGKKEFTYFVASWLINVYSAQATFQPRFILLGMPNSTPEKLYGGFSHA
jgi:hypothetical protein